MSEYLGNFNKGYYLMSPIKQFTAFLLWNKFYENENEAMK